MKFLLISSLLLATVYLSSTLSLEKRDAGTRDELVKAATALKAKATTAAAQARAAGKTSQAEQIEKQELQIEQLVQDIKAATVGTAAETQLEQRLRQAENKLAEEIAKDNNGSPNSRDELVKRAQDLKQKAKDAAQKARTAGKTSLAEHIEKEELQIEQLVQDIKAATVGTDAEKKLEERVRQAENKLAEEIAKVDSGSRFRRATKEEVVKAAQALESRAKAAAEKLRTAGKTSQAAQIEREEKQIEALVKEIQNETDQTKLERQEETLAAAEKRLTEEIKKAEGGSA